MRELYQEIMIMSCQHEITKGTGRHRKPYSRTQDDGWSIPNSDHDIHDMFKTACNSGCKTTPRWSHCRLT